MKFSILIAHYNNFEYFKDCHKSILNQTYSDFEVIIVDDFSTDGSYEKVKELVKNDFRFKIFQNKENKGVGYTKKRCIDLAQGEFCGFLDPDDALVETALEESVKPYQQENIVATYSQLYFCNSHLEIEKTFANTRKIPNGNPLFLNINFEVAHFFTFRKNIYLKTEKMENYRIAEDQDLYLKMYEKGDFYYIPQPLYLYRLHDKGLSHNKEKADKDNKIWHIVLKNALKRRNIRKIYGKNIEEIDNLPKFVFVKQNTIWKRILRKLKC